MYSYMFCIMKYYFCCICFILCKQQLYLSCQTLRMARLDDYNILQPEHLVENRLGWAHDLISVQNLISHGFACTSSQAMSRVTKEHLAWHDLGETRVYGGTRYPCNSDRSRCWNVWSSEPRLYATQP
jgi:hypothetical protein